MADQYPKDRPQDDREWDEHHWRDLTEELVTRTLVSWKDISQLVLGHLNPPQVGTSLASKASFQRHYEKRKTWQAVCDWFYDQPGKCEDCGTLLELQADHKIPKQTVDAVGERMWSRLSNGSLPRVATIVAEIKSQLTETYPDDEYPDELIQDIARELRDAIQVDDIGDSDFKSIADRLENMVLRCRRCNVIRRPSHREGGKTFLTTEAALMWLLLTKKPATYEEYDGLCRTYGLTMANIRFKEAWAMAQWLSRDGQYDIDG